MPLDCPDAASGAAGPAEAAFDAPTIDVTSVRAAAFAASNSPVSRIDTTSVAAVADISSADDSPLSDRAAMAGRLSRDTGLEDIPESCPGTGVASAATGADCAATGPATARWTTGGTSPGGTAGLGAAGRWTTGGTAPNGREGGCQ